MIYVLEINKKVLRKLSKKPQGTVLEYNGLRIKYEGKAFNKKHYFEVNLKDYDTHFNALISEEDDYIVYNKEIEKVLIVGGFGFNILTKIVDYEYITIDNFEDLGGNNE